MAKMKVFELKNLINEQIHGNIESKDILNFLENSLGVKKTHSSNLEDHEVKAVKDHFIPSAQKTSEPPANKMMRTASHNVEIGQEPISPKEAQGQPSKVVTNQKPEEHIPVRQGQQRPNTQGQPVARPTGPARPPQGQLPRAQTPRGQMPSKGTQHSVPQGGSQGASQGASQGVSHSSATQSNNQGNTTSAVKPSGQQSGQGAVKPQQAASTRPQQSQAPKGQMPKGQTSSQGGQQGASQGHYNNPSKQSGQGAVRHQQQGSNRPQQNQNTRGQNPRGQMQSQGAYQGSFQGSSRGPKPPYQGRPDGQGKPQGQQGQQKGRFAKDNQRPISKDGFGFNTTYSKDDDDKVAYASRSGKKGSGLGRTNERKNFDQQILDQKVAEKNDFNNRRNRDRINKEKLYKDKNLLHEEEDDISKIVPKKGQFIKPKPVEEVREEIKVITLPEVVTIKELADKMKIPGSALIKKLFLEGKIVTINQEITFDEAEEIALEYDIIAEKEVKVNEVEELLKEDEEDPASLVKRPPVVCVMGHVDHGKTSLLDAIRHSNVTAREAGGITQHIGAYMVEINGEKITFLDTPGHEAFTSMRMRGAQATDIAILVVAADDGVMPQTVEAISHAKAAGVKIIVAINKIDKPSANIERVKQELTEYELIAEDWGGDTIFVPVSAHTKEGINDLLEMILLTAEMEELKANPNRKARGLVIEAELDKGRGPVATILVQKGTLHVGDNIAVGSSYGKVRAMIDDKGRRVKEATPSTPVEILGLNSVPNVGETFVVTDSEKEARAIADAFIAQSKEKLLADTKTKLSLDGLFSQIQAGNIKELNLIIKADVQGSVEAMKQSLIKLSNDEVAVKAIHGGVGAINESDVILASTSNAIIIGFNVKPDNMAKERAEQEKVDIKLYKVIYNAISDVEAAIHGLLDPVFEEKVIGHAEVRQTFKASGVGTIAGSYVLDGKIVRGCKVRIYRDKELIHEGNLASLKRFQDDVKEVAAGYECGLVFEKFNDVKVDDKVEFYVMEEVPR